MAHKCSGNKAFQIIGSQWNLFVIWHLREGSLRFTEIQKRLQGVNSKTITNHLRILEKYGIIMRTVYAEVPPRVEYCLTEKGKNFLPILQAINDWGESIN